MTNPSPSGFVIIENDTHLLNYHHHHEYNVFTFHECGAEMVFNLALGFLMLLTMISMETDTHA